ncbi:LysR family transcriptional regulator [Lactobacillus sp.]|uniref:LysR family transcriptional regulator n=1 Tax=Lactobacillus sp. TaxID=1591 RepID=UPI003EFA14FA
MNTEHIAIFINLAHTLSFSKTAMNMGISQSAVSQDISSIEKELGTELFYRTRKKVALTKAGKAFYEDILPVYQDYIDTFRRLEALNEQNHVEINLGISGTPYEIFALNKVIKKYRQDHPKIQFVVTHATPQELVSQLSSGILDIAFLTKDALPDQTFNFKPLAQGKYCAVFADGVKVTAGKSLKHVDLAKERTLFLDENICSPQQAALQKALDHDQPQLKAVSANSMAAELFNLNAGLGIGIFPNISFPKEATVVCIPLSGKNEVTYGAAIAKKPYSDCVLSFFNWLDAKKMPETISY